jgi:hypothetical protein
VLESVFRLCYAPSFAGKVAATRLCAALLPFADPRFVDGQSARLLPQLAPTASQLAAPPKRSFIRELLGKIGEVSTAGRAATHRGQIGPSDAWSSCYRDPGLLAL